MANIFDAKITKRKLIAKNTWELTIEHGNEDFYFNAGQYVWIITMLGRRAFSISSSSSNPMVFQIIFRANNDSDFKRSILDENNSDVKIRGPFGFMRVPKEDEKITYIAGGVGIAPILSIIRRMAEYKSASNVTLIFANHNIEEAFYQEELGKYDFIKYINIYGKITKDVIKIDPATNYYVIGPQNMVDGVNELLLGQNIPKENIIFEENYPTEVSASVDLNDKSIFKRAVDMSLNHIVLTDLTGKIIYANKVAEESTGFSFSEMIGQTPRLWGGNASKETYASFWKNIKEEGVAFKGEFVNQRKNGDEYEVVATVSPIKDDFGKIIGFLGIEQDVTLYKKSVRDFKKLNDLMVGRELKMVELKKQIIKNE